MTAKRIVIDACVAFSCGTSEHPHSSNCRRALDLIATHRHKIVLYPDLQEEWDRHQSNYFIRWRATMIAKKLFCRIDNVVRLHDLRTQLDTILQSTISENDKKAILKDLHLIEAAIETDKIVLSKDEAARLLFRGVCTTVPDVRRILWGNPVIEQENIEDWITQGFRPAQGRYLYCSI